MDILYGPDVKTRFSESEKRIFISALRLFAEKGYENVAVGTLARESQVKISELYYVGGKKGLLNACYRYFLDNRYVTRMSEEEYIPIMKNGTREEVMDVLLYTFPESVAKNLNNCLTIIESRLYIDNIAREVFINDVEQSSEYITDFLNKGIEMGRIRDFDIQLFVHIFIGFRLYGLQLSLVMYEELGKRHEIEVKVFEKLSELIPFIY